MSHIRNFHWFLQKIISKSTHIRCGNTLIELPLTSSNNQGRTLFNTRELVSPKVSYLSSWVKHFAPHIILSQNSLLTIGASIGIDTLALMQENIFGHGIAVEPEPNSFNYLEKNIKQNQLEHKISCRELAFGGNNSKVLLTKNPLDWSDNRIKLPFSSKHTIDVWDHLEVQQVNIDTFLDKHSPKCGSIGMVLIDIGGRELAVFSSAQHFFQSGPLVCTKFSPRLIKDAGFSIEEYTTLVSNIWPYFYICQEKSFTPHHSSYLYNLYHHLGDGDDGDSIDLLLLPTKFGH